MADMRITNVPQASSVVTTNDFYCKIGSTFRRVPISALMTLIESEIDFTPEPNFNQKFLVMKLENGAYVIDNVNSDFVGTDYQTFAAFAGAVWQAYDDGYEVFCKITDGQYENAVPFMGNLGGAMLKFSGWELSANGLQPVVYTYTETYGFVREVIQMGGGGTADVTPTAVATAISGMNTSQKNDSRQALNAEIAGAAAAVQTNVNAILALIPSSASQNNQLATKNDLPTLTDRNSSTDTVEVKKDPTTQKLYVPTYPSGGAIDPADIVNATGQMDTTQQTSTRQNIGAEQAGAAAAVQTNLNAVTEKIPSNASSSNKLATQSDLPDVPTPTSSDNGKYLGVVNGAYALRSAPSGGGVDIYSVRFVYSSGYWYIQHDSTDIAAEDIFTALFDGNIVQVIDDAGAECELMSISYSPDEGRLVYKSCNNDNDVPEWRIFTIQDEIVQSEPRAEVTMTQVDLLPLSDSRTASQVGSGFTVDGNTVYTVSGTISGFALSTNALPPMLPGQCIEIQLVVGSTAITTATWPSWCKKMGGWDGSFNPNTFYDIVIDNIGNVFHSTREVSA